MKEDSEVYLLIKELKQLLDLKENYKKLMKFLEDNYYRNKELCDEISIILTGKKVFELDELEDYLYEVE